jgi:hypothetical protein
VTITTAEPRCGHCGSDRLRRAHSSSDLQRFLRRQTPLDRYACQNCGHRGWSWGRVHRRHFEGPPVPDVPFDAVTDPLAAVKLNTLAGRRLERRDHLLRRRLRLRNFVAFAVSLALGVIVAMYLQRCGAAPPPVE